MASLSGFVFALNAVRLVLPRCLSTGSRWSAKRFQVACTRGWIRPTSIGIDASSSELQPLTSSAAAAALLKGSIDVAFMVGSPDAPTIQRMLRTHGVRLLDLSNAEAFARRFPYLTALTLPSAVLIGRFGSLSIPSRGTRRFPLVATFGCGTAPFGTLHVLVVTSTRGGILIDYTFPQDGQYEISAALARKAIEAFLTGERPGARSPGAKGPMKAAPPSPQTAAVEYSGISERGRS